MSGFSEHPTQNTHAYAYDVEQQQQHQHLHQHQHRHQHQHLDDDNVGEIDPFLAGYLAGLAAANANVNATRNIPDAEAWPFQDGFTPLPTFLTPPSNASAPWSHPLSQSTLSSHTLSHGTSSPHTVSHGTASSQGFSPDHELLESPPIQHDVSPSISAVDKDPFDFNASTSTAYPPPLENYGWVYTSDGAANGLATQSSVIIEGDVPMNWLQSSGLPASSQYDEPGLNEPQPSAFGQSDGYNAPPPESAMNRNHQDQPWAATNTHVLPTTAASAVIQVETPFDASTSAPRETNLNSQAPNTSLPPVTQRSQNPKSSVLPVCILLDHLLKVLLTQTSVIDGCDEASPAGCHTGISSLWHKKVQVTRAIENPYCPYQANRSL